MRAWRPGIAACIALIIIQFGLSRAQNFNETSSECLESWVPINNTTPFVTDLTEIAFNAWLTNSSLLEVGISCNETTIIDRQLYPRSACQQGDVYELLFEADFTCFYNQTLRRLPDIADETAILADVVLLDAQLTDSDGSGGSEAVVEFVDALAADEYYPFFPADIK